MADGQNLNGRLTLGENTADNGGIRIAYRALQEVIGQERPTACAARGGWHPDGYTPAQRFFIAFGQVWCQNQTEQSARVLAKTDPHSSGDVADERHGAELRRVWQGVWLQGGPADDAGEELPRLVVAAASGDTEGILASDRERPLADPFLASPFCVLSANPERRYANRPNRALPVPCRTCRFLLSIA